MPVVQDAVEVVRDHLDISVIQEARFAQPTEQRVRVHFVEPGKMRGESGGYSDVAGFPLAVAFGQSPKMST